MKSCTYIFSLFFIIQKRYIIIVSSQFIQSHWQTPHFFLFYSKVNVWVWIKKRVWCNAVIMCNPLPTKHNRKHSLLYTLYITTLNKKIERLTARFLNIIKLTANIYTKRPGWNFYKHTFFYFYFYFILFFFFFCIRA